MRRGNSYRHTAGYGGAMAEWDPDFTIDQPLVRALLAEQFPELDAASARLLGEGWDNSVWMVEERWAFRFPRREIAIPRVRRELDVLPRLAPLLPVPIPVPRFVGMPSDRFPWPFFGASFIPGREPADAALTPDDRAELGTALGRFLRVLHAPQMHASVDPESQLPVDPLGRADMSKRVPMARQFLADVQLAGIGRVPSSVLLDDASQLAPPAHAHAVFLHGDLHLRHVLVDNGSLAAVIDWGDTCIGDPCIDLQIAWSLLPAEGRDKLLAEYGPVDEERQLRARVLAVSLCSMLAKYAHSVGHASLEREAFEGVERALFD